jgi:hypothetical protein
MDRHLAKHQIYRQSSSISPRPTVLDLIHQSATSKASISPEQAVCNWVVITLQPFSVIESESFLQMFTSYNIEPLIKSRETIKRRIINQFGEARLALINKLNISCSTLSLSFDCWTSRNEVPIFAVIAYWITPEFKLEEQVIEFKEIFG